VGLFQFGAWRLTLEIRPTAPPGTGPASAVERPLVGPVEAAAEEREPGVVHAVEPAADLLAVHRCREGEHVRPDLSQSQGAARSVAPGRQDAIVSNSAPALFFASHHKEAKMKKLLVVLTVLTAAVLLTPTESPASCSAQVICSVTVIQCNGQSVCQSGSDWVQCDNQARIYCPICQAQTTCCDGRFIYCNGYNSCSEDPGQSVTCDGHLGGICPDCPNW
jgi:hypothetical protein